jgi:hypothetical protein
MKIELKEISNEDYHAADAISRSGLVKFIQGPNHYKAYKEDPPKSSPAMNIGSAFHTLVLEPHLFNDEFLVAPEGMKFNTKAGIEFKKENVGKTIIKHDEMKSISAMAELLLAHPTFQVIKEKSHIEQSFFWEQEGVKLKTRPDMVAPELNLICDIKTTSFLNRRKLAYKVRDFGYDIQAAMNIKACEEFYQKGFPGFVLIFIENKAPYDIVMYSLLPENIIAAINKFEKALPEFRECLKKDEWPSCQPLEIQPLDLGISEEEHGHDEI